MIAPLTFIKNERKSSLDALRGNLTNLAGHNLDPQDLTNLMVKTRLALRVVPKRPETTHLDQSTSKAFYCMKYMSIGCGQSSQHPLHNSVFVVPVECMHANVLHEYHYKINSSP